MVFEKVTVTNEEGIHARPAAYLASVCMNCDSKVELRVGQNVLNPTNIFELLSQGIKCGTEVEITCDGLTEEEDLKKIISCIKDGMKSI